MFPPPELPDGDLNPRFGGPQLLGSVIGFEKSNGEEIEPEAVEAYIDVSDDVDWAVGIDVHRFMALLSHAEPAIDPTELAPLNEGDLPMTEAADFPAPALWARQASQVCTAEHPN
ncbi:hypothetical protein B0H14DRAFT_2560410 [Mycena olivaceomarginata]|nr:hypothetical protein B0H14DRAFT_2560410 [Mycena olivaceomarginata]